MKSITQDTTKQLKRAGKKSAKRIVREPLEVLKTARSQVGGMEKVVENKEQKTTKPIDASNEKSAIDAEKDKARSKRLTTAYETELKEIEKQNLLKELQRKIAQGEEVYLKNYPSLSIDEKQVLEAQMEVVRQRKESENLADESLSVPTSKKTRGIISTARGMKGKVERLKRKTEIGRQPSG